jgi:hypothetical protein
MSSSAIPWNSTYYEVYCESGPSNYITLEEASKHFKGMKAQGYSCILVQVDRYQTIDRHTLQINKV